MLLINVWNTELAEMMTKMNAKKKTKEIKAFLMKASKFEHSQRNSVLDEYIFLCSLRYQREFYTWRRKITKVSVKKIIFKNPTSIEEERMEEIVLQSRFENPIGSVVNEIDKEMKAKELLEQGKKKSQKKVKRTSTLEGGAAKSDVEYNSQEEDGVMAEVETPKEVLMRPVMMFIPIKDFMKKFIFHIISKS